MPLDALSFSVACAGVGSADTAVMTATLRRLIAFYVRAHNETIPHAAFNGKTPDERYFDNRDAVVVDLAAARVRARQERMKANRMATCGVCVGGHDFAALQLQRAEGE